MIYPWVTIKGSVPSKSNCYRIVTISGHGSLAKTATLKGFEKDFYLQCGIYRGLNIDDFFIYRARVYYKDMRHDLDNHCKIMLDCLQAVKAIKNDNKCVCIECSKFVDKENPRIEFQLESVEL